MNIIKQYLGYVVAGLILLAGIAGFTLGFALAEAQGETRLAALELGYSQSLITNIKSARKTERAIRSDRDELDAEYRVYREDAEREKALNDLIVDGVRDGSKRVSIDVKGCGTEGPGGDPAIGTGGGSGISRAELYPETVQAIFDIGHDANRNTRERNLCVSSYNRLRAKLNTR